MHLDTVPAQTHRLDEYADVFNGYRAIRMIDDSGTLRGELVWRLATGHTVEITELAVFDQSDRRQGWGTKLLYAGLDDMKSFFHDKPYSLKRVYLFCESTNKTGRALYEHQGFMEMAVLESFYDYCDAVLYVLDLTKKADDL